MGTNYYLNTNYCEHCKRGDLVHLGKASAGWTFSYQGTREIRNRNAWINRIMDEMRRGSKMQDESGNIITLEEMILVADMKRHEKRNHAKEFMDGSWLDNEGNAFIGNDFS
jgi:hypothetical protein